MPQVIQELTDWEELLKSKILSKEITLEFVYDPTNAIHKKERIKYLKKNYFYIYVLVSFLGGLMSGMIILWLILHG